MRSACDCLMVRFCLRDLPASTRSQCDSLSANGSSLLGRSGTLNFGATAPERRYLPMVFRDRPVRHEIARIESGSRNAQRRMTLSNAMSITPCPPLFAAGAGSNMGQISAKIFSQPGSGLGGNQHPSLILAEMAYHPVRNSGASSPTQNPSPLPTLQHSKGQTVHRG